LGAGMKVRAEGRLGCRTPVDSAAAYPGVEPH